MNGFRWLVPEKPRILDCDLQMVFILLMICRVTLEQLFQPQMIGARFCGNQGVL